MHKSAPRFSSFKKLLDAFRREERGATAIEYGLIAALISVAIIAAIKGVTTETNSLYQHIETEINNV